MRPFEILLLLTLFIAVIWPILTDRVPALVRWHTFMRFLPFVGLLIALLHLLLEHYRWQMVPAYLLTAILSLSAFTALMQRNGNGQPRKPRAFSLSDLLLWLGAVALPILLPVPQLPPPTGPYAVGTTILHLVDEARPDLLGDPTQPRELMTQIWYPAAADADTPLAPYLDHLQTAAPVLAKRLGLPAFFLGHINLTHTHAHLDAPVADDAAPFPVLLFSHGWQGMRAQNTFQMEELASRGYIVIAPDHTHAAVVTVLPPDRVVLSNPALLDDSDPVAYAISSNNVVRVFAADLQFLLDQAALWNESGPLAGHLDLARVGVFGHSTGGGGAVEMCGRDARCGALLVLDGWLNPVSDDVIAQVPYVPPALFMKASNSIFNAENDARLWQVYGHLQAGGTVMEIEGTEHFDFTDIPLLTPLAHRLGLAGTIGASRGRPLLNAYTLAFFDRALKNQSAPLLDAPSPAYPEVTFLTPPP
ncbi:MAG: hypothetical protein KC418_16255 [Anaerolineales bacterium]|nr:hypothetical protein [Anaerolineales bacterium]MCB8953340.1 hypothetical protein [Ardenticatenales bacterium]